MKIVSLGTAWLGAAALAIAASTGLAAEQGKKESSAAPLFSYKAPLRGAPATRVGGATRSAGATAMTLNVLAPDHTGFTYQEKPTIYWYVSERVTSPVELAITPTGNLQEAVPPVLELTLKPPLEKGVHALRLEDHGVALKPDVEYQWFVAVVKDPDHRSNDVLAGGSIKRIGASDAVQAKLRDAKEAMRPAIYAESGVWYDAIDQISKLIGTDPANRSLRELRATLLEQVGLKDAAAYDRSAGG